jgi:hypothetical protein
VLLELCRLAARSPSFEHLARTPEFGKIYALARALVEKGEAEGGIGRSALHPPRARAKPVGAFFGIVPGGSRSDR